MATRETEIHESVIGGKVGTWTHAGLLRTIIISLNFTLGKKFLVTSSKSVTF